MATKNITQNTGGSLGKKRRRLFAQFGITALAVAILSIWLMPLAYGGVTSLKTKEQISDPKGQILPAAPQTFNYEGEDYDVYTVPFENGETRELALVKKTIG